MKKYFTVVIAGLLGLSAAAQQKNDTGFVARNIRNHIISIKMAQMAVDRSDLPRIKDLAREIIQTDRGNLQKLLAVARPEQLQGPSDQELDSLINNFRTDSLLDFNDPKAAATSGNTATDSIGSGSTGSGNTGKQDTGTIGRTHSNKRNRSYSEQGDYLYRNQPSIYALQDLEKVEDKKFNRSWLTYMLGLTDNRLRDFEAASTDNSNQKLRELAVIALPLVRTEKDRVSKMANRDSKPAQREDPGRVGPTRQNSGK